ncbi:MAG: hypothetical protein V4645_23040 [Pseudomonadota bacterium]
MNTSHGSSEAQELAERLGLLSDEELTRRCAAGSFTELAHGIAAAELRSRGLAAPAPPEPLPPEADSEPEPYHGDMVTVARRFTPIDAHVLCACLESAGIPAVVADAELVQTNLLWSIAMGGVSLRVPQAFVQEANDVIAAFERGALSLDENFDPNQ